MKRFQSIIQKYIINHQKYKKYLAAVLALSVFVSFAVPFSLIMPAISMAAIGDGWVNVSDADTFTLYVNEDSSAGDTICIVKKEDNGSISVTNNNDFGEVTEDSLGIDFQLDYRFSNVTDKFPNTADGNRYMYVTTTGLSFPNYPIGSTGSVSDSSYGPSGTYTFYDGYILIEFSEDYIEYIYDGTSGDDKRLLGGTLTFKGTLSRDENGNEEQKFEIAGQEVPITFSSRNPEVNNKRGWITNPSDGTITWEVTIHNTYKSDLSNYVLTDNMLTNATEVTFSPNVGNHNDGSNQITFNSSTSSEEWITITYKTPIGDYNQGDTIPNTATLTKNGDDDWESHKDGSVYLDRKPIEVSKSGTPDYNNSTIKWTITVTSNYGESLEGYQIVDEAFSSATNVKVNNTSVTPNGNTLTLINMTGNVATIEYETIATASDSPYNNHVEVKKDGEKKDETDAEPVVYRNKSELVHLNKQGTYIEDDCAIEWTITITPENNYYLNGYELTDSQFPTDLSKFEISCGSDKVELSNGKLIFKSDSNVSGTVTISYKTPVDLPEPETTTAVSNDIGDNHASTTTVVTVTDIKARKSVSKSATGNTYQTVYSNDDVVKELSWKASIISDGAFADKTYTDTLSVIGDGAIHTITDVQLEAIQLKARKTRYGNETLLEKGKDYDIVPNGNGGFTITFKSTLDEEGYNYVDITYNTTAILGSDYATYQFTNGAGFDGVATDGTGPSYSIERKNPVETNTTNITLNKSWSGFSSQDKNDVTFKLQYRTDADNNNGTYTWHDVHGSEANYLFEDSTGYTGASVYTVTLNKNAFDENNNYWQMTLSNLTSQAFTKDEYGNTVNGSTVNYYYRFIEQKNDGSYAESSNDYFETDNGIYVIEYDNNFNYGVNGNSVTVTNKLYKNINITPSKQWNITENYPVDSITIELQKRIKNSGNAWESIATSVLTKESGWKFSEEDLNKYKNLTIAEIDSSNKQLVEYEYQVVETKIGNDTVGNDRKIVVDGGYIQVTNSGQISSDSDVTIKNEFNETKDLTYSVSKTWEDENNLGHRPDAIIFELQRQTNNTGSWETIETYEMNSTGNMSHAFTTKCPTQSIVGSVVTTYNYRVVETGYIFNGKTVKLSSGTNCFITDGDGYWTIETDYTNSSDEVFAIKNRFVPYETTSIKPQKIWANDADFASNRKDITLRLQYRDNDNAEWIDYEDITLTSSNAEQYDSNTWTGSEISNLPKSHLAETKVTENGETKTKYETKSYQYRFVELGDNGEPLADGASFKTDNGKYIVTYNGNVVTNTFTESIGITKEAIDENANSFNSIDKDDLSNYKHTINGKDYYVFNWKIDYETIDSNVLSPVVDKLPEGFTLCQASDDASYENVNWYPWDDNNVNDKYVMRDYGYYIRPYFIYKEKYCNYMETKGSLQEIWDSFKNGNYYYYDENSGILAFNRPDTWMLFHICYSVKIECDDLEAKIASGSFNIINQAIRYDQHGSGTATPTDKITSATLTIVNNIPTGLVTKEGTAYEINSRTGKLTQSSPGYYNFSIDVNPDGKNLSNGDTIDIEDIFKTTGYFDKDINNGTWYSGDKLIDVLMQSIEVSEVDVNGNKTPLSKSDYVLDFDNSSSVANGTALMKLTIPDEKHIVIDYTYKMIANENTPSVINGCRSDVRGENGKYLTMTSGLTPPAGDKIGFKNTVSLKSDSASDTANFEEKEYEFFISSATSYTTSLPKIIKVNTGNYNINNLQANFLIAQYNQSTGKWKYATDITSITSTGNNQEAKINAWSDECSGSTVPSDAVMIDVQTEYQIEVNLSQNSLYKLVEVKVPDGYEGSNLGLSDAEFKTLIINYLNTKTTSLNNVDYDAFLKKYVSTYYFVYNSVLNSYPDGIDASKVIQVKQGGNVEIPNNQLINIGVGKEWSDSKNLDDSITVELYWSYTKNTSGIPVDAELASATALGIMGTFEAQKTLKMSDFNDEKVKASIWTDLPNGKDGKPIYYYVKEIAYNYEGVTYTLDESDGTYKNNEEKGAYYPIYVGNAVNTTSSDTSSTPSAIVQIKNTQSLVLKKSWKDSNNNPLTKGVPDSITVSIYGTDKNTNEETLLFEDIELSGNTWEADITDKLTKEDETTIDLSQYSSFRAEETGINTEDYTISCVFNLNSNAGEITVTNKSKKATSASVTVNKEWSDGADVHENDSIKVSLYQSTEEITGLTRLNQSQMEAKLAGLTPMTDTDDVKYTVDLNSDNGWSYTWIGLPMDDEDNNIDNYYYYVLETMDNVKAGTENSVADKYQALYTATTNGAKTTFTVKNTRQAIKVQKEWYDENNILIPNEFIDLSSGNVTPNAELNGLEIKLQLFTKAENPLIRDGCHPSAEGYAAIAEEYFNAIQTYYGNNKSDTLKIVAFGDSITNGYWTSSEDYPTKLTQKLKDNGYTLNGNAVSNKGVSQQQIGNSATDGFRGRIKSDIPSDTNIVLLLGGTNDIHQNNNAQSNPTECMRRLQACIEEIQAQASDAIIIVGSIPHFDYVDANGNVTEAAGWWGVTEVEANSYIDQYNALIEAYASNTANVYYVDTCTAVDGIAPAKDQNGNPLSEITLNSDNNWTAVVDVLDNSAYYVTETKVTLNGEDVTDEWIASYENNGQKSESQTAIIVKNKKTPVPTTSLSVEKKWVGDSADTSKRNGIQLELYRTTTPNAVEDTWIYYDVDMPQYTGSNDTWTYNYVDLPAEDDFGNKYYYKVVEVDMDGYTVSYDNSDGIISVENGNAGTLKLTNTRTISLKFTKIWSDSETANHLGDKVEVNVYRSTNINDVPTDKLPQMFKVSEENVSVGVNKSKDITANKEIASVTVDKEGVIETDINGKAITITGLSDGKATITVTDKSGETATITVTVSALEIFLNGDNNFNIEAGTTGILSAKLNNNDTNAQFSSSDDSVISVSGSTITANSFGTADITATVGDISVTQTITVVYPSFSVTENVSIEEGEKFNIAPDTYGGFEYSSNSTTITVDSNGNISAENAKAGDTATITVKRNNEQKSINVTVIAAWKTLSSNTDHITIDSSKMFSKIEFEVVGTNTWEEVSLHMTGSGVTDPNVKMGFFGAKTDGYSGKIWEVEDGSYFTTGDSYSKNDFTINLISTDSMVAKFTVEYSGSGTLNEIYFTKGNGNMPNSISYKITYESPISYSMYSVMRVASSSVALADTESPFFVDAVILSNSTGGNWTETLDNLPVYDENGDVYYYWAEEVTVGGYTASYYFDDADSSTEYCINATNIGNGEITIKNTKNESSSVRMPSTGGNGVKWYYVTGIAIMLVSVTGVLIRRRKNFVK